MQTKGKNEYPQAIAILVHLGPTHNCRHNCRYPGQCMEITFGRPNSSESHGSGYSEGEVSSSFHFEQIGYVMRLFPL